MLAPQVGVGRGGASGRTWLCVTHRLLRDPCYSTNKYAGICRQGRGSSVMVSGPLITDFCWPGVPAGLKVCCLEVDGVHGEGAQLQSAAV